MTVLYLKDRICRNTFVFITFFITVYILLLAKFGINHPCWHDECHFVETVRLFMAHPSLETLKYYDEMSTPLPFILYAAWGTVFGDSLACLRVLSLIIAFLTYVGFFYLFLVTLSKPRTALLLTIFIAMNPYMMGTSIFVYTDMLTMLFLAIFCLAIRNRSPVWSLVAAAGGLLSRQYFIFMVIAAIGYSIWRLYLQNDRRDVRMIAAMIASLIPLAALFILWKGFCPVTAWRMVYLKEGTTFHPNSVVVYTIQLFIYMLPLVCYFWRNLYLNRRRLLTAAALCWIYWVFPVAVSAPGIAAGKFTVGYFHRLLRIWPGVKLEHAVFFACFTLALPVALSIIGDTWQRLRSRETGFMVFLNLSFVAFFLIMPFSYLHWEKYFMPLLPIVAIQIVSSASRMRKTALAPSDTVLPEYPRRDRGRLS